jgi:hypothetical protein
MEKKRIYPFLTKTKKPERMLPQSTVVIEEEENEALCRQKLIKSVIERILMDACSHMDNRKINVDLVRQLFLPEKNPLEASNTDEEEEYDPLLSDTNDIEIFVTELFHRMIYSYRDFAYIHLCVDFLLEVSYLYSQSSRKFFLQNLANCCALCAINRHLMSPEKDLSEFYATNFGEQMLMAILFTREIISSEMLDHVIKRRLTREFQMLTIEQQYYDVEAVVLLLLCCGQYFDQIQSLVKKKPVSPLFHPLLLPISGAKVHVDKYFDSLYKIAYDYQTYEQHGMEGMVIDESSGEIVPLNDNGITADSKLKMLIRSLLDIRDKGWELNTYQLQSFINEHFFGSNPYTFLFSWRKQTTKKEECCFTDNSPFVDCIFIFEE